MIKIKIPEIYIPATKINPFLTKYLLISCISLVIWLYICEKVNKDDFVKPTSYIIGAISFVITLIITLSTGINIYSIFFYIGGMQMLLYPAIVLEGSNGDNLGSHMMLFTVLEITVPLFIYLYFNPTIQLFG